jgi:sulfite reductase (NADPH) hemoprotein beta-component
MGRTPMVAKLIRDFVPHADLLAYLESIVRVYNRHGRRDNKYKARVKILVHETGIDRIREQVEAEFAAAKGGVLTLPQEELDRISAYFAPPQFELLNATKIDVEREKIIDPAYGRWLDNNLNSHRQPGYVSVTISLKPIGGAPGDATDEQMERGRRSGRALFVRRNPRDPRAEPRAAAREDHRPRAVYDALVRGRSGGGQCRRDHRHHRLPGARFLRARQCPLDPHRPGDQPPKFAAPERQREIGELKIKISGCINACGHHHAGHIGILGVEKKGTELYQITVGGDGTETASVGDILGPGFVADEVPDAIERLVDFYLGQRQSESERFIDAFRRLGEAPFKEALYGHA